MCFKIRAIYYSSIYNLMQTLDLLLNYASRFSPNYHLMLPLTIIFLRICAIFVLVCKHIIIHLLNIASNRSLCDRNVYSYQLFLYTVTFDFSPSIHPSFF